MQWSSLPKAPEAGGWPRAARPRSFQGGGKWSEASAGPPGPAQDSSETTPLGITGPFFAHGLLRVYLCYKHRVPKEMVEKKGPHRLLPPENSPSPLEKPGPWAEGDKPKSKEIRHQREC